MGSRAATIGEGDQRPTTIVHQLQKPVELAVVECSLGAALDGVVVGRDANRMPLDRAKALHQSVGRAGHRLVRRNGEHAVLDEAALVQNHVDPLASGELILRVDPGDRLGPRVIHRPRPGVQHLLNDVFVHRFTPLR